MPILVLFKKCILRVQKDTPNLIFKGGGGQVARPKGYPFSETHIKEFINVAQSLSKTKKISVTNDHLIYFTDGWSIKCLALNRNYRNSFAINRLYAFIALHDKYMKEAGFANFEHERDEEDYPKGSTPVWVNTYGWLTQEDILGYLKGHSEYAERLKEGQFQIITLESFDDDGKFR